MKPLRAIQVALLIFIATLQSSQVFGQENANVRWYVTEIAESQVGYTSESSKSVGDMMVVDSESKMVLNRLGAKTEMFSRTTTFESQDGRLNKLEFDLKYSENSTKSVAVIDDQAIRVSSTVGGESYEKVIPFKGDLLGPEGVRKKSVTKLKQKGDTFEYQTFMPLLGATTVKGRRTMTGREEIEVDGTVIDAFVVNEAIGVMPASTLWLDKNHRWIKSESKSVLGITSSYLTDRDQALRAAEGTILSPEIFARTTIRSNVRFPYSQPIVSLDVELTLLDPEKPWPELGSENQKVVSQTKTKTVLRITRPIENQKAILSSQLEVDAEFLAPNNIVNSDNADIVRISKEVINNQQGEWNKCLALKNWVGKNVEGDAGVVLASASEIVKNRRGTCSAFATLLCSMIRAAGIPCRYAQGYAYMSGIWGGHAWVEARIGDRWIPLDAAINNLGAASATRIQFMNSALTNGIGEINGADGNQLFGNIAIKTLRYTVAGKEFAAMSSTAFQLSEQVYENPGIGLRIEKSQEFQFSGTKDVFPKNSIVTITGPNAERVQVSQLMIPAEYNPVRWVGEKAKELADGDCDVVQKEHFGKKCFLAVTPKLAIVIIPQGRQALVVKAKSEDAEDLLKTIQSWISFN